MKFNGKFCAVIVFVFLLSRVFIKYHVQVNFHKTGQRILGMTSQICSPFALYGLSRCYWVVLILLPYPVNVALPSGYVSSIVSEPVTIFHFWNFSKVLQLNQGIDRNYSRRYLLNTSNVMTDCLGISKNFNAAIKIICNNIHSKKPKSVRILY